MTIQELEDLLQEIRDGRTEGENVDWKRKFWSLDNKESQREFLKDITAMANSPASPAEDRRIVLGVSSDGTIVDSPLPCDESKIQQMLTSITPIPSVRFETFTVEEKQIAVAEIQPPFDRPYVAKVDKDFFIWVRLGSSTVTASRQMLDRFYRLQQRTPNVDVKWIRWRGIHPRTDKTGSESDALVVPAPRLSLDDLLREFEEKRNVTRAKAAKATNPDYPEKLRDYEKQCEKFLKAIEDPYGLLKWYFRSTLRPEYSTDVDPEDVRYFSLMVTNKGSAPATGVRVYVKFPPWIAVFSKSPGFLEEFPIPPSLEPPPPPRRRPYDPPYDLRSDIPTVHNAIADELRSLAPPDPIRIDFSESENELRLEADSLDHKTCFGRSERFRILSLPNIPPDTNRAEVEVNIFWREALDWETRKLILKVEQNS